MLLRIIDHPASDGAEDTVQIIFEHKNRAEDIIATSYRPPITDKFCKTLSWYFREYPQRAAIHANGSEIVEELIKLGQCIGDRLLGEGHQALKLKQDIEKKGYGNLFVQIESPRVEFFKEWWEAMILPESKYVLSTAVNSYVRQFVQKDFPNEYPELCYELKAVPPVKDNATQFLQEGKMDVPRQQHSNHDPLRVLYLVSRPETVDLPFTSSNGINLSLNAFAAGGVIDYEIHQAMDWEYLHARLADKSRPVHILHYDGPVILENGAASFPFSDSVAIEALTSATTLSKVLVGNKVGLLSIDARIYLQNNHSISPAEGLAMIAYSAHQHGLGNILGLGEITNPWISAQCFESVYFQIAKGLRLDQAVIEARKALQSHIETALMTVNPIPFQFWSLLVHYSKQTVTFFQSPQKFETPNNSGNPELFYDQLFGFRSEMLPPLLNQVSDGQALMLISQLFIARQSGSNPVVSITGEPGTGKTQLAHVMSLYFAQKQWIDYGFYFDYAGDFYSPDDMFNMIAPVLGLKVSQKDSVKEKLAQLRCCFVLDNVPHSDRKMQNSENLLEALSQFLEELLAGGQMIVIIGEHRSLLHELAAIEVKTTPLLFIEQKIIAASVLRQLALAAEKLVEIDENDKWGDLLISLEGHPWLTKKLMPLLRSSKADELKVQVERHISDIEQGSKIERFYRWQWTMLKPVWQKLLILCSDVPGLLLEMVMIAADQKESFAPARSLFTALGETDIRFSEGLDVWESCGFLSRLPHGRIIDSRCLDFIRVQRENSCSDSTDSQKLQFYFSQLICEGVRLLTEHVVKQPNPTISNNLLFNRRRWVRHFENLWFNQDYKGFIGVKSAFDQLLQQAKLISETQVWSLNLLERTPVITAAQEISIEGKLSWLMLALSALGYAESKDSESILKGAEIWRAWFDSLTELHDKQHRVLFQQVALFLESFYRGHSDWNECILICKKAYAVYTLHDAWQKVIQSLRSLARYYGELGEKDQVLIFENKIINDIPYAGSPPGFQTQQMVDILLARLARADTSQAQTLLNELRKTPDAEKLVDVLDRIQCDIYYQEGNYLAALPYYCKIWVHALHSNQHAQIEQMKPRLMELEQKLGSEYFNRQFEREVPEGTLKPKHYVSSLH